MDLELIYSPNGTIIGAEYYRYHPSAGAAWTFLALFAGATIMHLALMFPFRAKFFIPMIIGGIMEIFGYYGRAWGSRKPDKFGPWILQTFLLLTAPPLISGTVYMTLGRMIRCLDARQNSLMGPRGMTPLFVFGDVVAFFSQLAGAGLQASSSPSAQLIGQKVVLGGLIFSVVLFSFFIVNIWIFHKRNSASPTLLSMHPQVPDWRKRVFALYIASIAILVRNIVRIAEYVEGGNGEVSAHEVFIYLFDGALMFIAMAIFIAFHPGRLRKQARHVAAASKKAAEEFIPMTERRYSTGLEAQSR